MIVTINVTQEDIDHGEKGNCSRCPVALAASRVLYHPTIWPCGIWFGRPCSMNRCSVPTPPEVTKFVSDFDSDRPVEPFSFTLTCIPEESVIHAAI